MKVILTERVAKIGQMGQVVHVKPGFARNYLLPQGKAIEATTQNIATFEAQKEQLEARNLETLEEARGLAKKIKGQEFVVIRSASDSGALYGSVTMRDAADAAMDAGYTIDRRQVSLSAPIRTLGIHNVWVQLHPEITVTIQLNVARSAEEAERQASGKSIAELAAEEEAAAEFEIQELFNDIGAAAADTEELGPAAAETDEPFSREELGENRLDNSLAIAKVSTRVSPTKTKSLSQFVNKLTDGQKIQISAAAEFLSSATLEISEREKRINKLLRLD